MLNILAMGHSPPGVVAARRVISVLRRSSPSALENRACKALGQSIGRLMKNYTCGSLGASTRNETGAVFLLAAGSIERLGSRHSGWLDS
jgi:hypothetical protein